MPYESKAKKMARMAKKHRRNNAIKREFKGLVEENKAEFPEIESFVKGVRPSRCSLHTLNDWVEVSIARKKALAEAEKKALEEAEKKA